MAAPHTPSAAEPGAAIPERSRQSISIALLFYLVTFGAVISANLTALRSDKLVTEIALRWAILGGVVGGCLLGSMATWAIYRRGLALGFGALFGMLVGAAAGGLMLVRTEQFVSTQLVGFIGSWCLIVLTLVTARYREQRKPKLDSFE